ncbi:MAG: protein kinase [Bryobacteraceae bacterium]|nr:protein kinase [Bryobacteraceae bacterium]
MTTVSGGDGGLRAALAHLVACSQEHMDSTMLTSGSMIIGGNGGAGGTAYAPIRLMLSDDLSGQRFGAYELLRRVGKGGMGAVYAARRADEEYRKVVAVKLVKPGMESEEILRRFKQERQLLARLDHPNIARLIDGGTEDGVPYLVMEFVEGTPIDQYCRSRKLTVIERLHLFVTLCSAVQYAHQSLVVHRDIKPPNILVSTEGVPKLLDFGIAKVLNPDPADEQGMTQASERPMTPDYASPEQVRGEPITTASDVYSLGVLFYELLTTEHPLRKAKEKFGFRQAICDSEPTKPSVAVTHIAAADNGLPEGTERLRSQLRGDLDAIALMALRKEPNRRYASVQHMAEDIQKHLQGLPVRAHGDSVSYRTGKFIRRHAASVVAATAIVIALVTSSIVSWSFYREANRERRRAEARFADVRQLARFVLFDFDKIMTSGLTPARKALAEKATEYLDRLEQDRGGDPTIDSELVTGYLKIGDLQGNLWGPNLGDRQAAKASYERALHILDSSKAKDILQETRTRVSLADLLVNNGYLREAIAAYEKARVALETRSTNDRQILLTLFDVQRKLAFAHNQSGNTAAAMAGYERMLELSRKALALDPNSPDARKQSAVAEMRIGEIRARSEGLDAGLPAMRHALGVYESLAASARESAAAQRPVASASGLIGDVLVSGKRFRDAAVYYRKALQVTQALVKSDEHNAQYGRDLLTFMGRLADASARAGDTGVAQYLTREALEILKPRVEKPDAEQFDLQQYAWILATTPCLDLRNGVEAVRYANRLVELTNGRDPRMLDVLALAYSEAGKPEEALRVEEHALSLLPSDNASELRKDLERNRADFLSRTTTSSGLTRR